MKKVWYTFFITALMIPFMANAQTIYQFTLNNIEGEPVSLETYKGKVCIIVNVASKCGYTPQYEDLEQVYEKYKEQGLVVLGFPANEFGQQEPGTNSEIQEFCTSKFGVTFPMFEKIVVKGEDTHPLYHFLTNKSENGVADSEVKWNFQKYLISREGKLVVMIPTRKKVTDEDVEAMILSELAVKVSEE